MLQNPNALLSHPQNAIFSPDGNHLVVVNWSTRHFNVYSVDINGGFHHFPQCVIPSHLSEEKYRPHGMCFSPDGNYLAVVYGSFEDSPWTIILYHVIGLGSDYVELLPCSSLKNGSNIKGVPKGITFSPDASSLVITFTQTNSVGIFSIDWKKELIIPTPTQELIGFVTQLCRPEDIAFSLDGSYCAVSK